jgi:hypothetical protein
VVEGHDHEIPSFEGEVGDDDVVIVIEANVPRADDRMSSADQQTRDGFDHILVDEKAEVSRL